MLANTPQPVTTIEKRMAVARCQRSLSVAIVLLVPVYYNNTASLRNQERYKNMYDIMVDRDMRQRGMRKTTRRGDVI
jgi:hypothetical protein